MKICYLTRSLNVKIGGLDRYSFEVIDRMSRKEGVEVQALVEQPTGKSYEKIALKKVSRYPWKIFFNISSVRKQIKNCDIVHALDLYPYGLVAAFANLGLNKRLFINGVGTESVVKLKHFFWGPILKRTYNRAEKVFCISQYTKKKILNYAPNLKNLEVVYLGVDYEKFANQSPNPEKNHRDKDPILVGVGQPKRRKGYHVAIKALSKLKDKYPNFVYYIIGIHGISKYLTQLKELAAKLGIEKNIKFLQNISDEELIGLYKNADVFLLPSVNIGDHFEGFGLVFLEAASCGLPAIGTRDNGIAEAMREGQTGLLVDQENPEETAEALDKLLSDKKLREKMGQDAVKFAHGMDWAKTVGNYLGYYND